LGASLDGCKINERLRFGQSVSRAIATEKPQLGGFSTLIFCDGDGSAV
jgi:hypothetical protein